MRVGICYLDGKFSTHRLNGLMGGEVLYIKSKLLELGIDCDIISCNNSCSDMLVDENFDINYYDEIIAYWASYNFYGGKIDSDLITINKLLSKFNKSIYFILKILITPI